MATTYNLRRSCLCGKRICDRARNGLCRPCTNRKLSTERYQTRTFNKGLVCDYCAGPCDDLRPKFCSTACTNKAWNERKVPKSGRRQHFCDALSQHTPTTWVIGADGIKTRQIGTIDAQTTDGIGASRKQASHQSRGASALQRAATPQASVVRQARRHGQTAHDRDVSKVGSVGGVLNQFTEARTS